MSGKLKPAEAIQVQQAAKPVATWSARGDWAIFRGERYGETYFYRQAVRFWQEYSDGTWVGLVTGELGMVDARNFSNFVKFWTTVTKH